MITVDVSTEVFTEMHAQFGYPTMRIIDPISEWTLDAGVTYDSTQDRFEDSNGDEVTVNHVTQGYTEADYVPFREQQRQVTDFPRGRAQLPGLNLLVKYTSTVDSALDDNWALLVGGKLYRLTDRVDREYIPHGVSTPALIKVELQEQVKTYT